ncbi:NUDIX domain-containing protein [Solwaraspora sp. WMMD1047]|uniref:NUDIX hydrolase n=1 Tax=Solwaraspora sp. WMMD1047 TaxID=3016102 RepID=UPI002417D0F0|nr:NUDIX domain-containing protein [Solwaraspora sp. WMMD1047]MDG4831487.1 NUDIX domain-containing protein [Solwaraspora sp. WMMD1047]
MQTASDDQRPGRGSSLARALSEYRPAAGRERADLDRARSLLGTGDPWRRDNPLHLTGSALIVHPASRRVLLRWHPRQRAWLQVGGHADPDETDPLVIALREGYEETGLTDLVPWPDGALVHLVVVPVAAGKGEPAHEHIDLRYVLATGDPAAARPESADAELRWLDVPSARALTTEANLREFLDRVGRLFDRH